MSDESLESGWSFDTLQVHAGAFPDPATRARAVPIFATTSYVYESVDTAAASFLLEDLTVNSYSRTGNPTTAAAERRIAALEGGVGAVAVASGQAATTLALLNIVRAGDHVVLSGQVYGGTTSLVTQRFPELGIEHTIVTDIDDPEAWRAAIRPNTRAFFAESIANPLARVLDIETVARVAHDDAGVPLIIDNTLATPYLLRPIDFGADIVVHSTTKFLTGHGTVLGGVVVDSGAFDFGAEPAKWPGLHSVDPGHGEIGYWERFHGQGLGYLLRLRSLLLRDYGPTLSAFNSFLLIQGIETLSLRLRQHVANTERIVRYLESHPQVELVNHPLAAGHPSAELAAKYLPKGAGSVFSFNLVGGLEAGKAFIGGVKLFSHLANIGDVRSLVIHPASTTNSSQTPEQRAATGIGEGLIRLSVGIEDADDLIADLERGFAAARAVRP